MKIHKHSLKYKILKKKRQPPEVFCKKAALKNFPIFTGKGLCWSLCLIKLQNFRHATLLKETSAQKFCVNIAKFLKTPILKIICERLLLPLEVFCKDFVYISYENASRLYLAAAYLFLNCNCILGYETSFSDRWGQPVLAKDSTLCFCSIYRSDQPLWKINGIA